MYSAHKLNKQGTIYSLDVLLFLFGTSQFLFIIGDWNAKVGVKKQQLELDLEEQTGSKSGKEYVKAVYCHPAYLTCR